jgi:uncharacterized protein YkwD
MNSRSLQITAYLLFFFYAAQILTNGQSTTTAQTVLAQLQQRDDQRPRVVRSIGDGAGEGFTEAQRVEFEKEVFRLINEKRAAAGLLKIVWSDDVARIARLHSRNMAALDFFGHKGADGKTVDERADQLGVRKWQAIGENIAFIRGFKNPLETAVEKWMQSPGHRENLLNPRWKETGIGIGITDDGTFYFTQVFLDRK